MHTGNKFQFTISSKSSQKFFFNQNRCQNFSNKCPFNSSDNSIGNDVIIPIEVETLLNTSNGDSTAHIITPVSSSNETSDLSTSIESDTVVTITSSPPPINGHIESNLAMQQPSLITVDNAKDASNDDKDIMLEWHRNKPSIWQQYYGSKRLKYSNMVKKIKGKLDVNTTAAVMSYVSIELFSLFFHPLKSIIQSISLNYSEWVRLPVHLNGLHLLALHYQ